jgi:hypothetical protein
VIRQDERFNYCIWNGILSRALHWVGISRRAQQKVHGSLAGVLVVICSGMRLRGDLGVRMREWAVT